MLWMCVGLMSTSNPKALFPFLDTEQEARHTCHCAELAGKGRGGSSPTWVQLGKLRQAHSRHWPVQGHMASRPCCPQQVTPRPLGGPCPAWV